MRTKITRYNLTIHFLSILSLSFLTCKKDQLCENITEIEIHIGTTSDMSFASNHVGYVSAGYDPDANAAIIAKTIDGGKSWQKIPVYVNTIPTTVIRSIYAKSIDSVYATYHSFSTFGVCLSKDGGLTWSNLGNFDISVAYTDIFFKNSKIGFVCRAGDILQTQDGGNNWETVFDYDGFGGIGKLFFTSDRTGYAYGGFIDDYGSFGTIVKTTDGGDTWTEQTSMREFVTCLAFTDDNTGYAFTFGNSIFKTMDGGINWVFLNNITGIGSSYYSAIVTGNINYIASGPSIFRTGGDCKTITEIYKSPVNLADLSLKAVRTSENTMFFLSSQQTVIKIVQDCK